MMGFEVEMTRLEQVAMFDIRCVKAEFSHYMSKLGVTEPDEKTQLIQLENLEILYLGPRRVLIKTALKKEQQIEQKLNGAAADITGLSVVNVSDLYLGIKITGVDSKVVMAHVVPLNLHELPKGHGTATSVFTVAGIVTRDDEHSYSIFVERSFFDYVWYRMSALGLQGQANKF